MKEPLFNGLNQVSNQEVILKMKYFIDRANKFMKLYEKDKKATVSLARDLRNELKIEYKSNDLQRIQKTYKEHELFLSYYKPAIADAYVKTTGQLTERKAYSFLWDVDSYMNYYMPSRFID